MELFNRLFIVWAAAGALLAYYFPNLFLWFNSYIVYALALVMFGMGSTVSAKSFVDVAKRPFTVLLGTGLQFVVMPLAAFLISKMLKLSPGETAGMILLGSCPGGTASNIICYLAKADVALSITLTTVSTLLAVLATPFLTYVYAGAVVDVPAWNMIKSVFQIVIIPVGLGSVMNALLKERGRLLRSVFPSMSVIIIVLIIAGVVAMNRDNISNTGPVLILAIFLHNGSGLFLGYFVPKLLGYNETVCRTICIEVGMQNSGLSVALAAKHFAAYKTATLPGAIFSFWHNLTGSMLASLWKNNKDSSDKSC